MTARTTSGGEKAELTEEELEAQDGEELPERAAMSLITPDPSRPEIVLESKDGIAPDSNPFPEQSE